MLYMSGDVAKCCNTHTWRQEVKCSIEGVLMSGVSCDECTAVRQITGFRTKIIVVLLVVYYLFFLPINIFFNLPNIHIILFV